MKTNVFYIVICLLAFNEIAMSSHLEDIASAEDRQSQKLQALRQLGNNLFNEGNYREAFNTYKEVVKSPNAELNDLRNCSDACRRVVLALPEGQTRLLA